MFTKNAFTSYHVVTTLLLPKGLILRMRTSFWRMRRFCDTQCTGPIFHTCLCQKFLHCLSYNPHLSSPYVLHHLTFFPPQPVQEELTPQHYSQRHTKTQIAKKFKGQTPTDVNSLAQELQLSKKMITAPRSPLDGHCMDISPAPR